MRRVLVISLRMAVVTAVLTGLIYPLAVWGLGTRPVSQAGGRAVWPRTPAARSSARELIGQSFVSDQYFHPRPSAAGASGYDAMASGASNLGPTSSELVSAVGARVADAVRVEGAAKGSVPVDMVTSSASGLDPDISPDNAYLQVARVAKARGLSADDRRRAGRGAYQAARDLGFLGEPRVNVLELNLALAALSSK